LLLLLLVPVLRPWWDNSLALLDSNGIVVTATFV
jgi:hypothetical protein